MVMAGVFQLSQRWLSYSKIILQALRMRWVEWKNTLPSFSKPNIIHLIFTLKSSKGDLSSLVNIFLLLCLQSVQELPHFINHPLQTQHFHSHCVYQKECVTLFRVS